MKTSKKLLIVMSIFIFSSVASASNHLCRNLTGTWSGTYRDPSGLFASGSFPIVFNLQYKKGAVYGYTLPADDSKAGRFGVEKAAYFLIARCADNTLSQIYFIRNQARICGDVGTKNATLKDNEHIGSLALPYENAMMNADLDARLAKEGRTAPMDAGLLAKIEALSGNIQTCH